MAEGRLPLGMTPRLLSREVAAAYCGISPTHFDEHIAEAVLPISFGRSKRWDVKALDRWLDQQADLAHAGPKQSVGDRLNGGDKCAGR